MGKVVREFEPDETIICARYGVQYFDESSLIPNWRRVENYASLRTAEIIAMNYADYWKVRTRVIDTRKDRAVDTDSEEP